MKKILSLFVLLGSVFGAQLELAQDSGHLNVTTIVQKEELIVDAQGAEQRRLVDAAKVIPGDEVSDTWTVENIST